MFDHTPDRSKLESSFRHQVATGNTLHLLLEGVQSGIVGMVTKLGGRSTEFHVHCPGFLIPKLGNLILQKS